MKTLLIAIFILLTPVAKKVNTVYICDSKNSEVYHSSKTCKGIEKCTHQIKEVSLEDAVNTYKRRPCKICY